MVVKGNRLMISFWRGDGGWVHTRHLTHGFIMYTFEAFVHVDICNLWTKGWLVKIPTRNLTQVRSPEISCKNRNIVSVGTLQPCIHCSVLCTQLGQLSFLFTIGFLNLQFFLISRCWTSGDVYPWLLKPGSFEAFGFMCLSLYARCTRLILQQIVNLTSEINQMYSDF